MKKMLSLCVLSLLVSSVAFSECYKIKLGNHQSRGLDAFAGPNDYICISEDTVSMWDGTGKNRLVSEFTGCTKTTINSYNVTFLDGTATTLFDPNLIICKHGLVVAYNKGLQSGEVERLAMAGLRYTITPTSLEIPVNGPTKN